MINQFALQFDLYWVKINMVAGKGFQKDGKNVSNSIIFSFMRLLQRSYFDILGFALHAVCYKYQKKKQNDTLISSLNFYTLLFFLCINNLKRYGIVYKFIFEE